MSDYPTFWDVKKIRPIFNENTNLVDIPRMWLVKIEPKIMRTGFKGHWIWYGGTDNRGTPVMNLKKDDGGWHKFAVARYVMRLFYEFPDEYYVRRTCEYHQCVNPHHLYISPHWKQE